MQKIISFILKYKIYSAVVSAVLILSIVLTVVLVGNNNTKSSDSSSAQGNTSQKDKVTSSEDVSSVISSEPSSSSVPSSSSSKPVTSKKPITSTKPVTNTNFKYNTNEDIENNVFLDSLVYTGYNLNKHRKDGLMWVYILASQKRAKGWLSKIGYGGGCSGYETDSRGLPNIARFERGGLVCASYVTYVYFNYLPNVAGIDTSSLERPDKSYSAHSWYVAASNWIKKGQAKKIDYTASKNGTFIKFNAKSTMPIGTLLFYQDYNNRNGHCSHVAIYAGYKNGYHWVFHVGNDNGPEFCAIERMSCGPDPQWPLACIVPTNIRFTARAEVTVTDTDKKAVEGASVTLKNSSGKTINLGKTNASGSVAYDSLAYGNYTLSYTLPEGYTADTLTKAITLTPKNNSCNKIKIEGIKKLETQTEDPAESQESSSQTE